MRLPTDTLLALLACHSTPGDEEEVRACLERAWRAAGWRVTRLGDYAVVAAAPGDGGRRPRCLICAHMDSPGYAVDRLAPPAGGGRRPAGPPAWGLVPLGGAVFEGGETPGVLKCAGGRLPVVIRKSGKRRGRAPDCCCTPARGASAALAGLVRHGDRVCFAAAPRRRGARLSAPFLDNRLGCWLLAELPRLAASWRPRCRLLLGATACEEMGGAGASVLARHAQPDIAVVLDATYATAAQQVRPGGGPVLTLSDASVVISPARRDDIAASFAAAGLPLQTEVYNCSGTDARAFPRQGLAGPVLALLLPTTGNHTPRETADLRDAEVLAEGLRLVAEGRCAGLPGHRRHPRPRPPAGARA